MVSRPPNEERLRRASDPNTDDVDLLELLNDPDQQVRWAVAENPGAGDEVRRAILASRDPILRTCLASTPNLPTWVVDALRADPAGHVRVSLAATTRDRQVLKAMLDDRSDEVWWAVAENPHVTEAMLETLAARDNPRARAAAASSTRASKDLLRRLAADPEPSVRVRIAWRRDHQDLLRTLLEDPDEEVREEAAKYVRADPTQDRRTDDDFPEDDVYDLMETGRYDMRTPLAQAGLMPPPPAENNGEGHSEQPKEVNDGPGELPAAPEFRAHFRDPLYDDRGNELTPFGSDLGSDFFGEEWADRLDELGPTTTLAWLLEQSGMPGDLSDYDLEENVDDCQMILTAGFILLRFTGQIDAAGKSLVLAALDSLIAEFPEAGELHQQRRDLESFTTGNAGTQPAS